MNVLAFVLALLALAVFVYDAIKTNSRVTGGLSLLTLAWIVQGVWETTHIVHT